MNELPGLAGFGDNRNLVAVNLFGRKHRPIADADCAPNFAMRRFKSAQSFSFVMRDVDARKPLGKYVPAMRQLRQSTEVFNGQRLHSGDLE